MWEFCPKRGWRGGGWATQFPLPFFYCFYRLDYYKMTGVRPRRKKFPFFCLESVRCVFVFVFFLGSGRSGVDGLTGEGGRPLSLLGRSSHRQFICYNRFSWLGYSFMQELALLMISSEFFIFALSLSLIGKMGKSHSGRIYSLGGYPRSLDGRTFSKTTLTYLY